MERVHQWMTSPAIVISQDARLPEARELMRQHRIRRLPVVMGENELVGIVTAGDINRISASNETDVRDYNMYYSCKELPIRVFMQRQVAAVTPETPLAEAARLMLLRRVRGLPVIVQNRVVGVIAESDLFRNIVRREATIDPPAVGS